MNKAIKYIIILIFLSNCSASKKDTSDNEKLIDIFKKNEPIEKEFNQQLKIKKLNTFKTNFEKISNYKISRIKKFNSNQPELFFTEEKKIIFFDGKGTIFKLNNDLKELCFI